MVYLQERTDRLPRASLFLNIMAAESEPNTLFAIFFHSCVVITLVEFISWRAGFILQG